MTEYKVVKAKGRPAAEEEQLNQLAAKGWDLVAVLRQYGGTTLFYLKRPKP